jgi:hypothetical protein
MARRRPVYRSCGHRRDQPVILDIAAHSLPSICDVLSNEGASRSAMRGRQLLTTRDRYDVITSSRQSVRAGIATSSRRVRRGREIG